MKTYTFTAELRTSIWFKILRYFNLKQPRYEFRESLDVDLCDHGFKPGDIIELSEIKLKIVKL